MSLGAAPGNGYTATFPSATHIFAMAKRPILVFLASLMGASLASADFDPLGAEALAPGRPALGQAQGAEPCRFAELAAVTLAEAVDRALCYNPQTREVWANARYQAALVGVARAAYLPGVDGKLVEARKDTTGGAPYRQETGSLTLSWLVYDFGRSASLENARELLEAAAASQEDKIQTVFLATVQAYYQVQAALASLEAAKVSQKAAEESFRAAEAKYQAGMVTPADKLQAQTAWSQAILTTQQAQGTWQTARGALAAVMGLDAHQAPALATPLQTVMPEAFERELAGLIEVARARRADLRAAEAQVRASQAASELARAGGRPTVSMANVATRDRIEHNAFTTSSSLGMTVTLPLFSGFNTTYKVKAAEAQVDAKVAQRDRIRLQVAQDVWNAYQNLQSAGQSLRTTDDLIKSAEAAEAMARGRYKAGVGSLLDLLTAQNALASARQQRVQAAYNWNLYRATLAQSMGALDGGFLGEAESGRLPSIANSPAPTRKGP